MEELNETQTWQAVILGDEYIEDDDGILYNADGSERKPKEESK